MLRFEGEVPEQKILDETSSEVERELRTLTEAQQELETVAAGHSILLVDSDLGEVAGDLKEADRMLRERGRAKLADLYLQKLFGGRLPAETREVFQNFLGPNVKLASIDVRDQSAKIEEKFSAVVFSGSPGNVSDALGDPGARVASKARIFHSEIFQQTQNLYQQAARQEVPVFGVCFGHQLISQERRGEVGRMPTRQEGLVEVEPADEYGYELIVGVTGEPLKKGLVPAYHGDAVTEVGEQSALALRLSNSEIVHGLFHINEGSFQGGSREDSELVKQLLTDARHVAFSVQFHPELSGPEKLISFYFQRDSSVFRRPHENMIAADTLQIVTKFLSLHGRFKKK